MSDAAAEIQQIAQGAHERPRRPTLGHCFSVWVDPAFSDSLGIVFEALNEWINATAGQIGFGLGARSVHDLRIVLDGARPVMAPYAGLAYLHMLGDLVVGGEVVIHPDYVRPKVVLHEVGHILGFADCELRHSVMGGLPIDDARVPDIDRQAWAWLAAQEIPERGLAAAATRLAMPACTQGTERRRQ